MYLLVIVDELKAISSHPHLPDPPVLPRSSSARLKVTITHRHRRSSFRETEHMKQTAGIVLSILLALPVSAAQVYTWVDDAGVTHFSETPPPNPATDMQRVNIQPPTASPDIPDDDFYSVINQAARMERTRLSNEKLAAEKKQADAEASRARAEAAAVQQGSYNYNTNNDTRYYPVYPYYPRYGHYPARPGHGHQPVHPAHPGTTRPRNPRTSLGKTPGMPGQSGSWR